MTQPQSEHDRETAPTLDPPPSPRARAPVDALLPDTLIPDELAEEARRDETERISALRSAG